MKALLISVATLGILTFSWQAKAESITMTPQTEKTEALKVSVWGYDFVDSFLCSSSNPGIVSVTVPTISSLTEYATITIKALKKGTTSIICSANYRKEFEGTTSYKGLANYEVTVQ